ncbi:MAG: hypothetical protein ACJ8AX_01555 [Gemmatimonadales bacterium]
MKTTESRAKQNPRKRTFGGAAVLLPALLLSSAADAQTPLVSTDELAPFDADFVRYPALTAEEREYYLQRWKAMLEEARAGRAEAVEAQSRGLDTQAAIDRWDQNIRDAMREIVRLSAQRAGDAIQVAKAGKASDIETLRKDITVVVEAGRAAQLMGDPSAEDQQRKLVEIVETFSKKFAETCEKQSFDPLIALGLQRQNAMLGTEVEVDHCAYRVFEATIETGTEAVRWRHCGMGVGKWKMKAEGLDVGEGEAELDERGKGDFDSHWTKIGTVKADVTYNGTIEMKRTEIADAQGHITAVRYDFTQAITTISGDMIVAGRRIPVNGVPSTAAVAIAIINENRACDPSKNVWNYR